MENQQLEEKIITISAVEDADWALKIKDQQGATFNIPKKKKGTEIETEAFKAIKSLPGYGMGTQKLLKFVTVDNNQGGKSKYVRIISEVKMGDQAPPKPVQTKQPVYGSSNTPTTYQPKPSQNGNSDPRGMTRCKIAEAFIKNGMQKLVPEIIEDMEAWVEWVMTGKNLPANISVNEDYIPEDYEPNVENIPF